MAITPSLQMSQSQRLTMTPALRQAIAVLQLTSIELQAQVETELATNPLIQEDDSPVEEPMPEGSEDTPYDDPVGVAADFSREASLLSWSSTAAPHNGDDDAEAYDSIEGHVSLSEHLSEQLGCSGCAPELRPLVLWLIGNLDDNGLLDVTIDECVSESHIEAPAELWQDAVELLQSFEPTGVGARSMQELILLQLAQMQPESTPGDTKQAMRIVSEAWDLLGKRDTKGIAAKLSCTTACVNRAISVIEKCDPHPVARFANTSSIGCIIPEVLVVRTKKGWTAQLNPNVVPRLHFDHDCFEMLTAAKLNKTELDEWKSKATGARNFIHAIEQRFSTITSVAQTIVDAQDKFFEDGPSALVPMGLKDVAGLLGIAESTVSRATAGKYMQTPQGTFELKSFFTSSLAGSDGEAVSSAAARKKIRDLVAAENPAKPLSDAAIATELEKQGIILARRTVAKYRELENIAAKSLRKRV